MRILLLSREYPPHVYGGAGVVVDHLSRALARRAPVEVRCFGDQAVAGPDLSVRGYAPWERLAGGPEAAYAPALERAWAGALTLIVFVIVLYVGARVLTRLNTLAK